MSTQKSNLKKIIKALVSEQISSDRTIVSELEKLDKSVKKLDKSYKALINASFSRVVLDDGKGGKLFDVQLYPKSDAIGEDAKRYDLRAYFHDSDRVYKGGLTCDEVCDFIKEDMKKYIEDESYVRKSLYKGKRPYLTSDNYKYKPVTLAEEYSKEQFVASIRDLLAKIKPLEAYSDREVTYISGKYGRVPLITIKLNNSKNSDATIQQIKQIVDNSSDWEILDIEGPTDPNKRSVSYVEIKFVGKEHLNEAKSSPRSHKDEIQKLRNSIEYIRKSKYNSEVHPHSRATADSQISDLTKKLNYHRRKHQEYLEFLQDKTLNEAKKKKEDKCNCEETVGEMEEVKTIKRQEDITEKDMKAVDIDELLPGFNLEELTDVIENAVWGAIKREVESTHKKTVKAEHETKNLDTKKNGVTVSKQKRHSKKTAKIDSKPKKHETDKSIKSKDTKVNSGKPKAVSSEPKTAKQDGKDEKYTPAKGKK